MKIVTSALAELDTGIESGIAPRVMQWALGCVWARGFALGLDAVCDMRRKLAWGGHESRKRAMLTSTGWIWAPRLDDPTATAVCVGTPETFHACLLLEGPKRPPHRRPGFISAAFPTLPELEDWLEDASWIDWSGDLPGGLCAGERREAGCTVLRPDFPGEHFRLMRGALARTGFLRDHLDALGQTQERTLPAEAAFAAADIIGNRIGRLSVHDLHAARELWHVVEHRHASLGAASCMQRVKSAADALVRRGHGRKAPLVRSCGSTAWCMRDGDLDVLETHGPSGHMRFCLQRAQDGSETVFVTMLGDGEESVFCGSGPQGAITATLTPRTGAQMRAWNQWIGDIRALEAEIAA